MTKRIGIYGGTFDPVHTGHVVFALQATEAVRLDKVYFMPEREPRRKHGVTHYGHRYAMLRRVVRPHVRLDVLESVDRQFSVVRTLPRLRSMFGDAELVFLMGSDVAEHVSQWPHAEQLAANVSFCVGLRSNDDQKAAHAALMSLGVTDAQCTFVKSFAADISSSQVRTAIRRGHGIKGLLTSVHKYAQKEWLYL